MSPVLAPKYSVILEPSKPALHLTPESPCLTSEVSQSYYCFPRNSSSNNIYQFVEHSKRKDKAVRSQVSKHVMRDFIHRRTEFRHSIHHPKLQWILKKKDVQNEMPTQQNRSNESSVAKSSLDFPPTHLGTHAIRSDSSPDKHTELPVQDTREAMCPCHHCEQRKARKKFREQLLAKEVYTAVREYFQRPASPPGNATDPFQTLPDKTTRMEQVILQHYLDVLPERLYAIRKDAPFNPNRYSIFPYAHANAAVFQWCLFSAACHYRAAGGQVDDSYILQRRSKAYRLMKEGLADPKRCMSDEVFLGIHAAVWVEARYGDSSAVRLHVNGLTNFLKRRGGVRSMIGKPWHVFVVQGLHLAGTGFNISSAADVEEMRQQTDLLTQMLSNIQEADVEFHRWQSNLSCEEKQRTGKSRADSKSSRSSTAVFHNSAVVSLPSFSPLSPTLATYIRGRLPSTALLIAPSGKKEDSVIGFRNDALLLPDNSKIALESLRSKYLSCRKNFFSPHTPMGSVLSSFNRISQSATPTRQHIFLAVLLSLNLALYEYRNDFQSSIYYLETLARNFKQNSLFDRNTGRTMANMETLNWFLVVGGLDRRGENGAWVQSEFERKLMVTDAIKVLARVGEKTRGMVQDALYGFLVDEEKIPCEVCEGSIRVGYDGGDCGDCLPMNDGLLTRIRIEVFDWVDGVDGVDKVDD